MKFPDELLYTKTHEWVRIEDEKATVGITDYAQQALGDIVYVELPGIGTELSKGGEFGVIESVKAASDVYAPLSGEVLEINGDLSDHPEFINQSPYEKGWMIVMKIKDKSEAGELMSSRDYESYVRKILEESE